MAIALTDRSNKLEEVLVHHPPRKLVIEQSVVDAQLAEIGNRLWAQLHSVVTPATLEAWEACIPNFGCTCRKFYKDWKASNPPSNERFFEWTVALHNAVNVKLGKPEVATEDARRQWML